jgi:hypothetical protein
MDSTRDATVSINFIGEGEMKTLFIIGVITAIWLLTKNLVDFARRGK